MLLSLFSFRPRYRPWSCGNSLKREAGCYWLGGEKSLSVIAKAATGAILVRYGHQCDCAQEGEQIPCDLKRATAIMVPHVVFPNPPRYIPPSRVIYFPSPFTDREDEREGVYNSAADRLSLLARICCGSWLSCSVSCSVFFPERRLLLPYVERYSSNIFGIKTFLPFSHRSCAFVRIAFSKAERF